MRALFLALIVAGLTLGAVACGGDDSDSADSASATLPPLSELAEPPPNGASPVLEGIYRQFQPPRPDPRVKGSGPALRKGEKVCGGATPRQIRERFLAKSDLTPDQRRAVAKLPQHERTPSANFVAGQLAALVYEKSLPEDELASYGFQGCIYALSKRLKRQLAPRQERRRDSEGL